MNKNEVCALRHAEDGLGSHQPSAFPCMKRFKLVGYSSVAVLAVPL